MPERIKGQDGWDGPVEIRLPGEGPEWYRDAKALAALIQDSAPVGTGTLKRDLSLRRAGYKRLPTPLAGFSLLVHNAYALIQDEGGHIPERRPLGTANVFANPFPRAEGVTVTDGVEHIGQALRWGEEGSYVFAKRAGPFELTGQHYLDRGVNRWINARGHTGLQVDWVPAQWSVP